MPVLGLACALLFAGCASSSAGSAGAGASPDPAVPPIIQPGQPGAPSRVIDAAEDARALSAPPVPADVRFMQGMIAHHAQAIDMSRLVPSRTTNQSINLLARRIDISQRDEIALIQQWLRAHGEAVPDTEHYMHGAHARGHGMLSEQEMAHLAAASGVEFERLFLGYMIRHHEGALVMVGELLASPGAAQETDVFRFASEVDTDQRIEIARMRAMLGQLRN